MIFCHVSGSFTILSCNASRRDPVGECLDDVTRRQSWSDFAERAERKPPEIFCRSFIMRPSRSA